MIKYITHYITTVCISIMLTVPVAVSAQTRRALVIGIGQQEDKTWGKINGDRDVPFVEDMLTGMTLYSTSLILSDMEQRVTRQLLMKSMKLVRTILLLQIYQNFQIWILLFLKRQQKKCSIIWIIINFGQEAYLNGAWTHKRKDKLLWQDGYER